jgi:flagellar protein FlaJ
MENNTPDSDIEDFSSISDIEHENRREKGSTIESESSVSPEPSIPDESKKSKKTGGKLKSPGKHGRDSGSFSEKIDQYSKKIKLILSLFKKVPFVLLGDRMKGQKAKYANLQLQLKQARIPISYEMYISNAIFYSIVSGLIGAILGLFAAYGVMAIVGLPEKITNLTF